MAACKRQMWSAPQLSLEENFLYVLLNGSFLTEKKRSLTV